MNRERENVNHIFVWPTGLTPPPEISLIKKLKRHVYSGKDHYFIELEPEPEVYQREGVDMQHCLQKMSDFYSQAAKKREIVLYSMIDLNGKPQIDIELALTRGCGVPIEVNKPTVMQIRGFRNACPPADYLFPDLISFLLTYGKGWIIEHDSPNFDGKRDGKVVMEHYRKLQKI